MKELFQGKIITAIVITITIILAGVAVFTALRLYELRNESLSLKNPESKPGASSGTKSCNLLTFTLTTISQTPTPTLTGTATPSPTSSLTPTLTSTPTPTTPPGSTATPTNSPTPTSQSSESPTPSATKTPTPTNASIAAASPTPSGSTLPDAGVSYPTIFVGLLGILLIVGAFLLVI